jgi:hypothetical protein
MRRWLERCLVHPLSLLAPLPPDPNTLLAFVMADTKLMRPSSLAACALSPAVWARHAASARPAFLPVPQKALAVPLYRSDTEGCLSIARLMASTGMQHPLLLSPSSLCVCGSSSSQEAFTRTVAVAAAGRL